jgi:hypothetical protein
MKKLQFRSHDYNFDLMKKSNLDLIKFDLLIISRLVRLVVIYLYYFFHRAVEDTPLCYI